MAKSSKKNQGKGKTLTPAQKGAITRAKNKAIAMALEKEKKLKQQIRNKIAYRVRRLKNNVSILKQDAPLRNRYTKELRALYKEQNPKKNKQWTKKEKEIQESFRSLAKIQLKNLLNIDPSVVDAYSKKEKTKHVNLIKYYQSQIDKITTKILKEPKEQRYEIPEGEIPSEVDSSEVLDIMAGLLSFQMQDQLKKIFKNGFFDALELYVNSDLYDLIDLRKEESFLISSKIQDYVSHIRRNICISTVYYVIELYSNKVIRVTGTCSTKK